MVSEAGVVDPSNVNDLMVNAVGCCGSRSSVARDTRLIRQCGKQIVQVMLKCISTDTGEVSQLLGKTVK